MPLTMALALNFSKKISLNKCNKYQQTRLFSTTKLRLSTILRSAIIYALAEKKFFIQGSQHPIILYSGHKPVLFFVHTKGQTKPQSI